MPPKLADCPTHGPIRGLNDAPTLEQSQYKRGTRKICVRVSYEALQALEKIRLRWGGSITSHAAALVESAQGIQPGRYHTALAALEKHGSAD